ncbi:peptidase C45 [Corallococcus exercitus]|uniref:C45 family autoproteolytic acyltransferase/hydolase n=1 Tax=Corallococcus exercitus TaxID=2316736 RepID=UPI000EA19E14|nr:C45 family peptidase [Corallococcus exercitus]RKG75780.1 peptidase C45 [Corallococcus exercitus]
MLTPLREVTVSGDALTRGAQHGEALRKEIQDFVRDDFARVNRIRHAPLPAARIWRIVDEHRQVLEAQVPELAREVQGLARGADIRYEEALLLQLRRELLGAPAGPAGGDCSTLAVRDARGRRLAQTVDQDGLIADLGIVLRILPEHDGAPEVLMFTFAGLLGYLGLNSFGLGVSINLLTSDMGGPGVPPYLLVREALARPDAASVVGRLEALPRASARALTLFDARGVTCCEFTPSRLRAWHADSLLRTNHFLHEELVPDDRLNIFSRNGSRRRLELLKAGLASAVDDASTFTLLSDHSLFPTGLCAHAEGDVRRPDTVAAVVMRPDEGVLSVTKGNPCRATPVEFRLSRPPDAARIAPVLNEAASC